MSNYYTTWWMFDLVPMLFSYLIGIYGYYYFIKLQRGDYKNDKINDDVEHIDLSVNKFKNPFLIFLTVPLFSFFSVGLYFVIPTLLYCLTIWMWQRLKVL